MTVIAESTIHDHLDFLVMQPDQERAIVRDLVSAVFAFNAYSQGEPLQVSFPMFTDSKVAERGVTIIVIEHLMKVVLSISHRVIVLHHGQLIAQGRPKDVVRNHPLAESFSAPRQRCCPTLERRAKAL